METNPAFSQYLESQRRFQARLNELGRQTEELLEGVAGGTATAADVATLDALVSERRKLFEEYQSQAGTLVEYLRKLEQETRKAEQENRKTKMAEKRAKAPASQADIEKLSEELSTKLRTDRIDNAMKEILAFLGDADFFAANATVGRKRRLRQVQKAIEGALG